MRGLRTETGTIVDQTADGGGPPARREIGPWVRALAVVGATAAAVMAFYLSIYRARGFTVPLGWDTSRYIWRTTLAQSVGVSHLKDAVPAFVTPDPGRPAFPVVAGTLSSLLGVSVLRLSAILPSVMAAALALSCGAFVSSALRRPGWELVAVATGVGTSAFVVRLMGPETYQDNLFAAAVFLAAATALAAAVRDRRALVPAILLLGGGGVIHWAFFAVMVATIGITAVLYAPASWRRWRKGSQPWWDTPSARMVEAAAGGTAIAATGIFGVLGASTREPRLSLSEFTKKLSSDLPKYRFKVTLPVAAVGLGSLAVGSTRRGESGERTRFVLAFLAAWGAVTGVAYVAFRVLHVPLPAHRFLAFALAIPLLAMLGVLWVGRLAGRAGARVGARGHPGRARAVATAVSVGVVAAVVWASASSSHARWAQTRAWMDPAKVQEAANANGYLDAAGVASNRPLVFIVLDRDGNYVALMSHMIRAALPADRISQTYVYAGEPLSYLARRATPDASGTPNAVSVRYLRHMEGTYRLDPVALILRSTNADAFAAWTRDHPDTVVSPGVAVVRGPLLPSPSPPAITPLGPFGRIDLAAVSIGSFAVLLLVGLGWTVAMTRRWLRPLEMGALAPAFAVAVLVLGGVLADRLEIRLAGVAGALVPIVVGAAGWAVFWLTRRRRAESVSPEASPPGPPELRPTPTEPPP